MNKIKQAMDVIDVITNVMDETPEGTEAQRATVQRVMQEGIKSDREAIDRISVIIRVVHKHGFNGLGDQLDEIRQWLGRDA